jgi:hypothetical protein
LIQTRLATPSFAKIRQPVKTNSLQAQIADSNSKNAVNFPSSAHDESLSAAIKIVRP